MYLFVVNTLQASYNYSSSANKVEGGYGNNFVYSLYLFVCHTFQVSAHLQTNHWSDCVQIWWM